MKRTALALALIAASTAALADQYVHGHFRKDGTYVQPHYRSSPNHSTYDNYSTRGNYNPWTGEKGTVDPYASQLRVPSSSIRTRDYGYRLPSFDLD